MFYKESKLPYQGFILPKSNLICFNILRLDAL